MKPGLMTGAALLSLLLTAAPMAMAKPNIEIEDVPNSITDGKARVITPHSTPKPHSRPAPRTRNFTPGSPGSRKYPTLPRGDNHRSGLPVIPHTGNLVGSVNGRIPGHDPNRNRNPGHHRGNNNGHDGHGSHNGGNNGHGSHNGGNNGHGSHNGGHNWNSHGNRNPNYHGSHDHYGNNHNRNDHYRNDHRRNDRHRHHRNYWRTHPHTNYWVDPWYSYPGPYYDYYGSGVRFSFFGGYGYQAGWSLYPWWYGDDYWGYRTRSGYRTGYGHIGHSNVYCTDPTHPVYQNSWQYDDSYFAMHSQWTDGAHGGYDIRDCHMENTRGTFAHRSAMVRETVCWDENQQTYIPTGAVQLISYF